MSPFPPLVAVGLHAAGQGIFQKIMNMRPGVRGSYDLIKNNLNQNTRSYKYVKGECRVDRGTYRNLRNFTRRPIGIAMKNGSHEPASKPFVSPLVSSFVSPFSKAVIAVGLPVSLHSIHRPACEKSPMEAAKADQTTHAEKKKVLDTPRRPAPLAPNNILAFPHGESSKCIAFITSFLAARTTIFENKQVFLSRLMGKSGALLDTTKERCEDIFRNHYLREFENLMHGKNDEEKSSQVVIHCTHAHAEDMAVAHLQSSKDTDVVNYGKFLSKFEVKFMMKAPRAIAPPPIPDRSGKLVYQRNM